MTGLSTTDVSVSINGRIIVRNVSLTIASALASPGLASPGLAPPGLAPPGQCIGLIGPNGSGKTTLFNAISGFLPVSSGAVYLDELELTRLSAHARARAGLGRVFQSSGIFRDMTIRENLQVARENSCTPKSSEDVQALLVELGLGSRQDESASSLSGGQLRLLEIIRCLAAGARAILLDEPTAGVSPKMRGELQTMIKRVQAAGVTLFVIEHDMNFISELCSRVFVMHEGALILEGTPAEVRASPQLAEIYFGK